MRILATTSKEEARKDSRESSDGIGRRWFILVSAKLTGALSNCSIAESIVSNDQFRTISG